MSSRPPKIRARASLEDAPPRALIEAWREEPLDAARLQRAFSRFRHKSATSARRPAALLMRWVTFGVAIGMGSVYAASTSLRPSGFGTAAPAATSAPKPAPVVARPRTATQPGPALLDQPALPSSFIAPQPAEDRLQAPVPVPAPVASSEQWTRTARGLREGDFESANVALSELARRGSDADRESALLVQAQVFLSQGKTADAMDLLRRLQASAKSPSIRSKSAELLARATGLPSARSFEAPAGTNLP